MAAIILGKFKESKSLSDLTNIIVDIRRARDSMVETPAQFRYVSRILKLGDTSMCQFKCGINQSAFFDKYHDVNEFLLY